ncbi:hypothetical protein Pcac1_g5633 [Phytophthora cactorum]|uniref:Uncharacterized protein n=1 Tax=Phytophthora cactorum TaxID=29920 RepID=A0A329RGS0_9STRA|nr:hypothetical protein Pcac1_g5633 [Phytophthora cactorum]RAW22946.1 hypothetical protein PC110_g20620 [Phytophthora cactorum]
MVSFNLGQLKRWMEQQPDDVLTFSEGYFTLVKSKVTRLRLSLEPQLMDISTFSFGSMRITGVWGILSTKWLLPLGMDAYKG